MVAVVVDFKDRALEWSYIVANKITFCGNSCVFLASLTPPTPPVVFFGRNFSRLSFLNISHMWLMIGFKTAKCDMRVLRVPVTWVLYFCTKIPTRDPCDMRDMCDMHDIRGTFGPL